MLAEFRTALEEEIDAAKRNLASSAVSLTNGRRIARVGKAFQYTFDIESALALPADAPGDLVVPGKEQSYPITILSVEDLRLSLSIETDLGPAVPYARLQSDLTMLLRKLIERIESKAEAANPAGNRILGLSRVQGSSEEGALPDSLNAEQNEAVRSCLGRDATFIWGPPGTGKTKTIGAIGEQLFHRNRSLLLVSHTNTAVDEALLQIADALNGHCKEGDVVRVGEPAHERLRQRPELLLKRLAEKRSEELRVRKEALCVERASVLRELVALERAITICEWAGEGAQDIVGLETELANISAFDELARDLQLEIKTASENEEEWNLAKAAAVTAVRQEKELAETAEMLAETEAKLNEHRASLAALSERLQNERVMFGRTEEAAPLRTRLRQIPNKPAQVAAVERARLKTEAARRMEAETRQRLDQEKAILEKTSSVGTIKRMWLKLPRPEEQAKTVTEWTKNYGKSAEQLRSVAAEQQKIEDVMAELIELETRLQAFAGVPETEVQSAVVRRVEKEITAVNNEAAKATVNHEKLEQRQHWLQAQLDGCARAYAEAPAKLLGDAEAFFQHLTERRRKLGEANFYRGAKRQALGERLRELLGILRNLELTSEPNGEAEEMLAAIRQANTKAVNSSGGTNVHTLHSKRDALSDRVIQIDTEVKAIEEALKRVEEQIIAEARVVATTLTRAYMRDSIQARTFDTVVLDEASMAPIPALWIAASLASQNAVVVGDFKQLPPIVQSKHPLAERWLGRDIFDVSGVQGAYASGSPPHHFKPLCEQFRMHPAISAVPNALFYDNRLRDAESVMCASADDGLLEWYNPLWGHDAPVLLVSTESTGAWVTSVAKGGGASRLNFLSACICVDLAEQFLADGRSTQGIGERPRILIVCPYRPHAKLLNLLIREQKLESEVIAGTTHSFQGSEADVVILDLVVDEPHWRTNLTNPQANEDIKRLLNVAITRARRRLVVLGDFAWCMKSGRQSFLGRELLPFLLRRHKPIDALKIVPDSLAARAAQAQMTATGGHVEADAQRLVVTQANFYPLLHTDIGRATKRVVIYSPFLTTQRVGALEPQLRAAIERGVLVFAVTKPHAERKSNELAWCVPLEQALRHWGVKLVHKAGMHEKLVFIDDTILWSGSLNPLSYSNTQEIMERRCSAKVVSDYADTLRLADLLSPFEATAPACPICAKEMIAAEGADGEPFYWRCVEDGCYTRSVDDPPLKDGMLSFKCGTSAEYGKWGDAPYWYCTCGRNHRFRVHRNHLRLPKMVALIPKKEIKALEKLFEISISVHGSGFQTDFLS
ncbi:MAG TPA: AAA domain-containing protein [Verrucomicrobiae bacterium]